MSRFILCSLFFLVLAIFAFAPASSYAAAPKLLGKSGYWSAYQIMEGRNKVCYMSLTAKPPTKKKSKLKRSKVVLMITHRPAENVIDVISYAAGVKFKPSSDASFKIDKTKYSLFTQGDTAWARDQASDRAIAMALRRGYTLTVVGTASNGETIADSVNLKGSGKAYDAISEACGVDVEKPKSAAATKKMTKKPSKKTRQ